MQADVLVHIVRGVTARVDDIEDALLAGRLDHKRARLGMLRRVLVRCSACWRPSRRRCSGCCRARRAWMSEPDAAGAARLDRGILGRAARHGARCRSASSCCRKRSPHTSTSDNNRSLFVLTVVTVLALPINILAGLFGMNVGGIPLAEHKHGFWIVVAIVVSFTAIAAWVAFRNKR